MKSIIKKNLNIVNLVSRGDDYQVLFTANKKIERISENSQKESILKFHILVKLPINLMIIK